MKQYVAEAYKMEDEMLVVVLKRSKDKKLEKIFEFVWLMKDGFKLKSLKKHSEDEFKLYYKICGIDQTEYNVNLEKYRFKDLLDHVKVNEPKK